MEIGHLLGFAGFATIYFITLYYIGLNRWMVQENTKMYDEFRSLKAEITKLKQSTI